MSPPDNIISLAVEAGSYSPCAKSNRGAVVFYANTILGVGYNTPPAPFTCNASDDCKMSCNKYCVHAEMRALVNSLQSNDNRHILNDAELVHAKVIGGKLVAGGPPSCVQCSRQILDLQLKGVWLYEEEDGPEWRFYNSFDFHKISLINCGINYEH